MSLKLNPKQPHLQYDLKLKTLKPHLEEEFKTKSLFTGEHGGQEGPGGLHRQVLQGGHQDPRGLCHQLLPL